MKQIENYSNYTIVKEWADEQLESRLDDVQKLNLRKIDKKCIDCGNELSFYDTDYLSGILIFICTYCHREYDLRKDILTLKEMIEQQKLREEKEKKEREEHINNLNQMSKEELINKILELEDEIKNRPIDD